MLRALKTITVIPGGLKVFYNLFAIICHFEMCLLLFYVHTTQDMCFIAICVLRFENHCRGSDPVGQEDGECDDSDRLCAGCFRSHRPAAVHGKSAS